MELKLKLKLKLTGFPIVIRTDSGTSDSDYRGNDFILTTGEILNRAPVDSDFWATRADLIKPTGTCWKVQTHPPGVELPPI